jgi:hypothetical protein
MNDTAVAGAHGPFRDVSGGDAVHDFFAILLGIAGEQSGLPSMLDQFTQRAAGLHHLRRQVVHAQIGPIADHDAACRIGHAQALRHVVEGVGEAAHFRVCASACERADGDGEHRAGDAGHHVGEERGRHDARPG